MIHPDGCKLMAETLRTDILQTERIRLKLCELSVSPARYAHPIVLDRMIRILREGRAQSKEEALDVLKADLRALTADVQVEQEEHDEVVVIKPLFLVSDYQ